MDGCGTASVGMNECHCQRLFVHSDFRFFAKSFIRHINGCRKEKQNQAKLNSERQTAKNRQQNMRTKERKEYLLLHCTTLLLIIMKFISPYSGQW